MRTTLLVALAVVGVIVVSCAAPTPTPTPTAAPISFTLLPDASLNRVKEFRDKGNLSFVGATFLALTKLEVTSSDKNLYKFVATFPTNTTADMIIRMTPDQKYTPTPEEAAASPGRQSYNARLTHTITGDTYQSKVEYFLPNGVLPVSFDGSLQPALPQLIAIRGADTFYGTRQLAADGGEQTGIVVAFEVAINQGGQEFVGVAEESITTIVQFLKGEKITEGNPLTTTATSALDVVEALNMSGEYQDMVAELNELQASAENPTNPLTRKAYEEDPSVKQRILDEIADARAELKGDTAVLYLNKLASVGLGLAGSPLLSIAVSPVADWTSKTLTQLMKDRVKDIRKMVTTGTGSLTPKPGSGGTGDTGGTGYIKEDEDKERSKLKPGTWLATYEGMHKSVGNYAGHGTTITDKGRITFTVMADSVEQPSVEGTGQGHLTYHDVGFEGDYDGKIDYTFSVLGYAECGMVYLIAAEKPNYFDVIRTPPRTQGGPPRPENILFPGPMLVPLHPIIYSQRTLKLESGGTVQTREDKSTPNSQITETRTITIVGGGPAPKPAPACASTPAPVPTPTRAPTRTPTPTPTTTPVPTPTRTPTFTPTPAPTPTPTRRTVEVPTPTPTPTP